MMDEVANAKSWPFPFDLSLALSVQLLLIRLIVVVDDSVQRFVELLVHLSEYVFLTQKVEPHHGQGFALHHRHEVGIMGTCTQTDTQTHTQTHINTTMNNGHGL